MAMLPQDAKDLWVVAQTVWGESRSESQAGQIAVVWVIRNRQLYHPTWEGQTLTEICQAPYQFSCWNAQDPNRAQMEALMLTSLGFADILHLVVGVLGGNLASPVGKATHYYAKYIAPPTWALGETPCAIIGVHRFFENIA
jgi:N-acetylmuramoyl-L-alanine amidase